jgi:hypothetical protein
VRSRTAEGATLVKPAARRARKYQKSVKKHVKLFTLKYEERTDFNDSVMSNFLVDKEILRWESHFFERKNEFFWTVLVEYRLSFISQTEPARKTEKG